MMFIDKLFMRKLYTIIITLIIALSVSSCSLFDFLKDNDDKDDKYLSEEEIQQLSDVENFIIQNQSADIVSSFEQFDDFCNALQEMPGVAQVDVKPYSQITLTMEWGSKVFIPLDHITDWLTAEGETAAAPSDLSEPSGYKTYVDSKSNSDEKKKFLIVVHPDFKDVYRLDEITELYRNNEYDVVELPFYEFTFDFIKNELPAFDVSFIATHGASGYKSDEEQRGLIIGGNVSREVAQDVAVTKEVYSLLLSEGLSEGDKFKPNSLMIIASCYSLDNDRIADALKARGLNALAGFSGLASANFAIVQVERLSRYLLEGYTLEEAYDRLGGWNSQIYLNILESIAGISNESTLLIKGDIDMRISDNSPAPIPLQATLKWDFYGDVDLHCFSPRGHLYFDNPTIQGAYLDYDNIYGGIGSIENIYWDNLSEGEYTFKLHYFRAEGSGTCQVRIKTESIDQTIRVPMSYEGQWGNVITLRVDKNGRISTSRAPESDDFEYPSLPPKKSHKFLQVP